ncbi:energy transducer TonB [Hymenobacter crusticola]|uniref:TonB C-terminal domain-containing protein n=1 Tax=Hymenobacter crusticola TaxID=1770526 RepID=A0A243WC93_9BACT|nr:energy transducer TonB [Hymenobacter crusticola]OUJ73260.1 hypothetical protein BXP70_15695 [Hymenobacter crusticola]
MPRTRTLLALTILSVQRLLAQSLSAPLDAPAGEHVTALPSTQPATGDPLVYYTAEEMPTFPGGDQAFLQFIKAKVHYPDEALQRNLSGKVYIGFVVDEEGRILDPKVVRGLGAGLDQEALRLVRIMPWWRPGRVNGRPVRVAYTLPVVFRCQ